MQLCNLSIVWSEVVNLCKELHFHHQIDINNYKNKNVFKLNLQRYIGTTYNDNITFNIMYT